MTTFQEERHKPCTALDAIERLRGYDPQEPVFILRAQDMLAPDVIARWIDQAVLQSVPKSKIEGAVMCLRAFFEWPNWKKKFPD